MNETSINHSISTIYQVRKLCSGLSSEQLSKVLGLFQIVNAEIKELEYKEQLQTKNHERILAQIKHLVRENDGDMETINEMMNSELSFKPNPPTKFREWSFDFGDGKGIIKLVSRGRPPQTVERWIKLSQFDTKYSFIIPEEQESFLKWCESNQIHKHKIEQYKSDFKKRKGLK